MYTVSKKTNQNPFLDKISESVCTLLEKIDLAAVEEIRLRKNMPLTVHMGQEHMFICKNSALSHSPEHAYIVTDSDIERTMELLCRGSIYSFQEQIKSGYITVDGGHRVGIAGRAVIQDGRIEHIKDISGFNFRFARQIKGAADNIIKYILCPDGVKNTLIISPPGYGKTTMLRDIARQSSEGGFKTCIIDERSELAAMSDGMYGYDVGPITDVLDTCPKAEGIMLAIRSLSPQLIVCDEIGSEKDISALRSALRCGVGIATSIHGKNAILLFGGGHQEQLLELFDVFITLGGNHKRGSIESVYTRTQLERRIRDYARRIEHA